MEDKIIQRRTQLLEATVGDELVALHVEQGRCYGFNSTAMRIWSLIETPMRVSELRSTLMGEFEIDEATCSDELDELLNQLEQVGLATRRPVTQ